ncbi:DUF6046 domain-containing protein [Bacteroides sp. AN502(2024)]|uniref:DUF6046 domain-containing protein n=1 Tax=Bacteroides sp. AN502(2024) TaxID=3160599 RepID=UPI0035191D76
MRYAKCTARADGQTLATYDVAPSAARKTSSPRSMVGMDGTVKEYINEGDYQINIVVGVVAVRASHRWTNTPEDGLRELRAFFDEKAAIDVHSVFLEIFDIGSIVIKSFSVSQDTASNYQSASISAMSDGDYNVYSTEY